MKLKCLIVIVVLSFSYANPQMLGIHQKAGPAIEIDDVSGQDSLEGLDKEIVEDDKTGRLSQRQHYLESNSNTSKESRRSRIDVSSLILHDPIDIGGEEDFETQGWPGSGTAEDPYVISGRNIVFEGICILITDTIVHFVIRNCILVLDSDVEEVAIMLINVRYGIIEHNTIERGNVELNHALFTTVTHNDISNLNWVGVAVFNSRSCFIGHNDIKGAPYEGIRADSSKYVVYTGNRISECSEGFFILDEQSSNFTFNYVHDVWNSGIIVELGQDNLIFGNFVDTWDIGWDNGASTQWDDGIGIGNYWANRDATVPVEIPGTARSVDNYPIFLDDSDLSFPVIVRPSSFIDVNGVDSIVTWIVWSDQGTFSLHENGSQVQNGTWEGSGLFELHLTDPPDAVYNYTLTIQDFSHGNASDMLFLLVPSFLAVSPPSPPRNLMRILDIGQVELSWDETLDDGNLPIVGYKVYRGTTPDNYILLVDLGVVTTYTDSTILPGTLYFYIVKARNALLEGQQSNSVNNLAEHDTIHITSNSDFQGQDLPGNGTQENPFKFTLLNITSEFTCFNIADTDVFFVIESCWISAGQDSSEAGIFLNNVKNAEVRSSFFDSSRYGVLVNDSSNLVVRDCILRNNRYACSIDYSSDCEIDGSVFDGWRNAVSIESSTGIRIINSSFVDVNDEWYSYRGVTIRRSTECSIQDCTFSNSRYGVQFDSSTFSNVTSCSFDEVSRPLELWMSANCTVAYCRVNDTSLQDAGISLSNCQSCSFLNITLGGKMVRIGGDNASAWVHSFVNVTIDSKPIGYFAGLNNHTVDASLYPQLIIASSHNCTFEGMHVANVSKGISIAHSSDVSIQNLVSPSFEIDSVNSSSLTNMVVYDQEGDFRVSSSSSVLLHNISFLKYFAWGMIRIEDSQDVAIVNSHIDVHGSALEITDSDNCTVSRVLFEFHSRGIWLQSSSYPIIQDCRFNGEYGSSIELEYSSGALIEDCVLVGGGIEISGDEMDYWIHVIRNVSVNGIPFFFAQGEADVTVDSGVFSQITIVDCQDVHIQDVTVENASIGFQIAFSEQVTIHDSEILNQRNDGGPSLYECDNVLIYNIEYRENDGPLRILSCSGLQLRESSFVDCWRGVALDWGHYDCHIVNCQFISVDYPIVVRGGNEVYILNTFIREAWRGISLRWTDGADIQYNDIADTSTGMQLQYVTNCVVANNDLVSCHDDGLDIYESSNNVYSANRILYCNGDGIDVSGAYESEFSFNEVSHSNDVGLRIRHGSDNLIFGNLLFDNSVYDAADDGSDNQWDDGGSIGNCWGLNRGDLEYIISGSADSTDHFPLTTDDFESPIISSPLDVTQHYTSMNPLTWIVWMSLGNCTLFLDGFPIYLEYWVGCGSITTSIHDLSVGIHNFTISVIDLNGFVDSDTVLVTIVTNDITWPLATAIIAGVVVVLGLLCETRGRVTLPARIRRREEVIQ